MNANHTCVWLSYIKSIVINWLQDGEPRVRVEIHPLDVTYKHGNIEESINALTDQSISPAEISPVQNFLGGKNCLHGASTWSCGSLYC